MKYKLVIFDLDNTLVITKPAAKVGYQRAIHYLAQMNGQEKNADKLYHHWKRIVQTLLGENKPYKRRFAYSLKLLLAEHNLPETHFQQALNLYEKTMLDNLRLGKGAKELLSSLKTANIKLSVATGSEKTEAKKKLTAVNLFQYFDLLITSSEVGFMKPSTQYYLQALSALNVKPEVAVVIGDSQTEDIDPAVLLGLKAFLVTPQTHLMEFKPELI